MVIYVYRKNLFGDVTEIYDGATCVAKYKYDAWGNCTVCNPDGTVNTSETFIGNINPFRYRGYYWDNDLQLYYLQTRYYDPAVCRFISPADISTLTPNIINGLNLYSYGNNNPIAIIYNNSTGGATDSREKSNFGYHGIISNGSNILSSVVSLSAAFGFFDQWSGYLSGGLDAGLSFWGPDEIGFQFLGKYSSVLKKFGVGMAITGNVLSWASSVYKNFTNPNYTIGEAVGASAMDAIYYAVKGFGSYWLGSKVGELAVAAGIAAGSAAIGTTVFGTTIGFIGAFAIGGGVAFLLGIAGALAIYFLGEKIDDGWEWLKKQIFE